MSEPQARNPLHGLTLEAIVTALVAHYGWERLGELIALRCFTSDPSISSSLKFLRKTPWAREKVESLYLFMLRDIRRQQPPVQFLLTQDAGPGRQPRAVLRQQQVGPGLRIDRVIIVVMAAHGALVQRDIAGHERVIDKVRRRGQQQAGKTVKQAHGRLKSFG